MRLFKRVPVVGRAGLLDWLSAGVAAVVLAKAGGLVLLAAWSGAGWRAAWAVGWAGGRVRVARGGVLGRALRGGWSSLRQTLLRVAGALLAGAGLLP